MSDYPERAFRSAGDDGAKYLSIPLLTGGLLLLSIPALWLLSALEWAYPPLAAVAVLTLTGWWLARRRGWDDQERQARLLGLALLCCLVTTLLDGFLAERRLSGFGTDDVARWLVRCGWLLQLLLSAVSLHLLFQSFPLLPGRLRTVCRRIERGILALSGIILPGPPPMSDGSEQAARPAGDGGARRLFVLLLSGELLLLSLPFVCQPSTQKWTFMVFVPVAMLTLTGWRLAQRQGWHTEKRLARLLGLSLLCSLAITLLDVYLTERRFSNSLMAGPTSNLSLPVDLVQIFLYLVSLFLLNRSCCLMRKRYRKLYRDIRNIVLMLVGIAFLVILVCILTGGLVLGVFLSMLFSLFPGL
ncbi:hypothetical protein [uncultured Desulfovibrio sp.]|uniref:hypothetical protein n=1 Tax=uncultured Desulfovibrio sp. TaxID=167968 RepID=UPI002623E42C|nr:hypothetical protein [uncultured Desulfovibrio sp.]